MPKIMQRPHIPTMLVLVAIVLVMFCAYHVTLGRRRR